MEQKRLIQDTEKKIKKARVAEKKKAKAAENKARAAEKKKAKAAAKEYAHYNRPHPTRIYSSPEEETLKYASITSKKCSKCNKVKILTCYNGNTSGRDGFTAEGYRLRRPECSDCTKAAGMGMKVARRIAKEQHISYKAPNGTCCAICQKANKKMVFDHCHKKKVFRGYLCDPCNRSMGAFGDNIEGLIRVINYLQPTENKTIVVGTDGKLSVLN